MKRFESKKKLSDADAKKAVGGKARPVPFPQDRRGEKTVEKSSILGALTAIFVSKSKGKE